MNYAHKKSTEGRNSFKYIHLTIEKYLFQPTWDGFSSMRACFDKLFAGRINFRVVHLAHTSASATFHIFVTKVEDINA